MEAEIPKSGYVENAKAIAKYTAEKAIESLLTDMPLLDGLYPKGTNAIQDAIRNGAELQRREDIKYIKSQNVIG